MILKLLNKNFFENDGLKIFNRNYIKIDEYLHNYPLNFYEFSSLINPEMNWV